jgi:hypothetical protein
MPLAVGCSFVHGLSMTKKWPVHPVSAMANCGGGGVQLGWLKFGSLLGITALAKLNPVAVAPNCQLVARCMLASLPPMGLLHVALF